MAQSLIRLTLESNQYERNLKNAKKQWEDFTKSIGVNVKSMSKIAVAAGAVSTALKVAKDAFSQSRTMMDEWGRTVQSAESVYNSFLNSLNSGDISGFLSNINQIVSSARDAYDALSNLQEFNAFNQINVQKAHTNLNNAVTDFRNGNATKADVEAANEILKNELRERGKRENAVYEQTIKQVAKEYGANANDLKKLLAGNYTDWENQKHSYVNAGSKGFKFTPMASPYVFTGQQATISGGPASEDERLSVLARNIPVERLDALQQMGRQAESTNTEIANLDKTLSRLLNKKETHAKGGKGGGDPITYAADSVAAQQALVAQLQKQWNEAGGDVRGQYLQPLIEAEGVLKRILDEQTLAKEQAAGRLQGGNVMTSGLGSMTGFEGIGGGLSSDVLPQVLSPLQQINAEIARTQELMQYAPTSDVYQQMKEHLEELLVKQGQFTGDSKKMTNSWQMAASAVSNMGSALNSIEDPAAKIMSLVAQAIASVAAGAGQAISAKDTTASGWAWIGAAAAITGQMIAIISQIHSSTGFQNGGMIKGYSTGGTIQGNSYSGDNIGGMVDGSQLVGLNAGELVLNKAQQATLAQNLQGGGNIRMTGEVTGEKIVLVANRYLKRTGQGEIVTW